ncbi:ROK family protein [Paenibacillus lutrae]|uniref:ROK family protein n=1 Tax=Paenibacillus lutrae TaxID=2078573 RepID=A0A7X3JZ11_9BACL|nr:ROK family protein [Paenibacillus lutrae]MVO99571.1 ROK family protein [Paenibacillus lutrae]
MRKSPPQLYLGVDLGGTAMKGAVIGIDGSFLAEQSVRTPVERGRTGILAALKVLIADLLAQSPGAIEGIGIGSAGRIDAGTGTVLYATDNLPGWTGTAVTAEIAAAFPYPVFTDNDVNVAAIGEGWLGAAEDLTSFAFIALGTGVGGALVADGRLIRGTKGAAGEFGHMLVQPGGIPCNCGQRGCLEQYASGTALNRIARAISPDWDSYIFIEAVRGGNAPAIRAMHEFTRTLAAGLVNVHNLFDPPAILLGGGLIDSRDVWWSPLESALQELTPVEISVRPALLGNRAGILGAARMAMPAYQLNESTGG